MMMRYDVIGLTYSNTANIITPSQETIHHFIFTCQAYTDARNTLKEKISQEHFNLPNIMSKPTHLKNLITYINKTKQLKATNPHKPH